MSEENLPGLGARKMSIPGSSEYVAPVFDLIPEKKTHGLMFAIIIPIVVVFAFIGWVVFMKVSAAKALETRASAVVEKYYDLLAVGDTLSAGALTCNGDASYAYSQYEAISSSGGYIDTALPGAGVFETMGIAVVDALPEPKKITIGKAAPPSEFDPIVKPAYAHWGIVTGVPAYLSSPHNVPPVSFHVAMPESGADCIMVIRSGIDDAALMNEIGAPKQFVSDTRPTPVPSP